MDLVNYFEVIWPVLGGLVWFGCVGVGVVIFFGWNFE